MISDRSSLALVHFSLFVSSLGIMKNSEEPKAALVPGPVLVPRGSAAHVAFSE